MASEEGITGVVFEGVGSLRGSYPDVPFAKGVDDKALIEGDVSPMFLTLPIAKVGAVSRNNRRYSLENVKAIQDAIQNSKPGGIKGHLRSEDRAHVFNIPSIVWVGEHLDEAQTLWGKAYILPHANDVREYARVMKATNGEMGTSIYGTGTETAGADGIADVLNLKTENIDLAHPSRVGVPITAAVPKVTSEMEGAETPETTMITQVTPNGIADAVKRTGMSADALVQALAQRTGLSVDEARQQYETKNWSAEMMTALSSMLGVPLASVKTWAGKGYSMTADTKGTTTDPVVTETQQVQQLRQEIRELTDTLNKNRIIVADYHDITKRLSNPADTVGAVQAMMTRNEDLLKENAELLEEAIITSVKEAVKVESHQLVIIEMVMKAKPATRDEVKASLKKVMEEPFIKVFLRDGVQETMGKALPRPVIEKTPDKKPLMTIPKRAGAKA